MRADELKPRLSRWPLLLLCALVTVSSCDEEEPEVPTGMLRVRVVDSDWNGVANARVFTKPSSPAVLTDPQGWAVLEQLRIQDQVIWAMRDDRGSGLQRVDASQDFRTPIEIELRPGDPRRPYAQIQPQGSEFFSYVDLVPFAGIASSPVEDRSKLRFAWSSSIGGVLHEGTPSGSALILLAGVPLEKGEHRIFLRVTDSAGRSDVDSVAVSIGSLEPSAAIIAPRDSSAFKPGLEVRLVGSASDYETPLQQLRTQWISDHDGVLYDGPPQNNGFSQFVTTELSPNRHRITFRVTDQDGQSRELGVVIDNVVPSPVEGLVAVPIDNQVHLSWDPSADPFLERYDIFRNDRRNYSGEMIGAVEGIEGTSFVDALPALLETTYYYVRSVNSFGYSQLSDIVEVPSTE